MCIPEVILTEIYNVCRHPSVILTWINGYITNRISRYFVEIDKDSYIIHYPYGVRWYRIKVSKTSGPSPYITKISGDGKDVTAEIKQLMGPSNNFHNQPASPESLGYKKMIFEYALEDTKEFNDDDTIVVE